MGVAKKGRGHELKNWSQTVFVLKCPEKQISVVRLDLTNKANDGRISVVWPCTIWHVQRASPWAYDTHIMRYVFIGRLEEINYITCLAIGPINRKYKYPKYNQLKIKLKNRIGPQPKGSRLISSSSMDKFIQFISWPSPMMIPSLLLTIQNGVVFG